MPVATDTDAIDTETIVRRILHWYDHNARDLPWRRPSASAWQIMVSEFMLQQTPVGRVLVPWQDWVSRWPTPAALAAAAPGEAVRAWGRLGYPRRALRLHQAATVITAEHGGRVPDSFEVLQTLPGVGAYTAAAIASFAYRRRHVVLDTNVRRVLIRISAGTAYPGPSTTNADLVRAGRFLPADPERAARWAVAAMELGAVVCTARLPRCQQCPVQPHCAWHRSGRPVGDGPPRRSQTYTGTDRQCRGALLAVLRASAVTVTLAELESAWPEPDQRRRALTSLCDDGLVEAVDATTYALPGSLRPSSEPKEQRP